jgi:hypothetical protein
MFRIGCVAIVSVIALHAVAADAQTPTNDAVGAVVEKLFDAMKASDTAATRNTFLPAARVIPIQPGAAVSSSPLGLSVDQFVAFVGRNPQGSWIERVWEPSQHISGPLADLWFEYDVYKGATFDHCGVNAVQLQQTASGWKIVSMAFTSATQGCASHPPPK